MRPLPDLAVFSRADARALGWSDPALTRAVRSGRVLRLRRDQFTGAERFEPRLAAIAAVRGCRGSVVSHSSAALLHGLPLVGGPRPLPEVTVAPSGTGDLHSAHLYRATLRAEDVVMIGLVPVTSVARTVVDLGRHRTLAVAVAAADHALHHGLTTVDELRDVLDFCALWPRAGRARRMLRAVDGLAESPLESVSRLTIAWLGLPKPTLQQRIRNDRGIIIARTDFYWDEFGVVGEADGRSKFERDEDVDATWDRHTDLDDLGLQLVRWGWLTTSRHPHQLRARLRRAFDRGQRRDLLGLPRRWSLAER